MDIGEIITNLRKEHNLTQQELGEILSVSSGTISNYEHNVHEPDLVSLNKMADYFKVTTDFLLGRTQYRCTPEILESYRINEHTVCDITNTILAMDQNSQDAIIKYIEYISIQKQPPQ